MVSSKEFKDCTLNTVHASNVQDVHFKTQPRRVNESMNSIIKKFLHSYYDKKKKNIAFETITNEILKMACHFHKYKVVLFF